MDERSVANILSIEGLVDVHSKDDCHSVTSFSIRLAIL